jgi:hypothetical protein
MLTTPIRVVVGCRMECGVKTPRMLVDVVDRHARYTP